MENNQALVVDDNDDLLELLATLLRHEGYTVETASSGFEAIEKFQQGGFCVVLSDIGMPVMNGYELARKLRSLPECKKTVMIAITGFQIYGDRARALAAGFDDLFTKPIAMRSLLATVERLRRDKK